MLPPAGTLAPHNPLNFSTPKQLETYFYRPRCHDGCFLCIQLLQYFLDLYSPSIPLRIRHGGGPGKQEAPSYITTIDTFRIVEQTLIEPLVQSNIVILPKGNGYRTGDEETMLHAVARFPPLSREEEEKVAMSFLDLSSLQFGDIGRGPGKKGQGLFALDTDSEYGDRLQFICEGIVDNSTKISHRMQAHPVPATDK